MLCVAVEQNIKTTANEEVTHLNDYQSKSY